jgi:hypothetical protein
VCSSDLYDSWSVGVNGSVTIHHDVIEFSEHGNTLPLDNIISDRFLNFGAEFFPKNINSSSLQLDTATYTQFKLRSDQLEKQRTIRKNVFFVFKLNEITYFLNSGISTQEKIVIATDVEITVSIPIDVGQTDCCSDNINNPPKPLNSAIIPTVIFDSVVFNLNNNIGIVQPIKFVGGTSSVTASINPELPKGLNFNKVTAEITGTPETVFPPTVFTVTFKDVRNETASEKFKLKIDSRSTP